MPDYTPCTDCGRPMRPWNVDMADAPGTIRRGGHGYCSTCIKRRNGGRITEYKSCPRCGRTRIVRPGRTSELCADCYYTPAVTGGQPPWMEDGLCAQTDPELFFSTAQGVASPGLGAARRVCEACPVTRQCLDYAIEQDIQDGIWGGRTPAERRRLTERRAA